MRALRRVRAAASACRVWAGRLTCCVLWVWNNRYEVISTPTDIFVVMEYVPNGELFEHIVHKGRVSAEQ